MRILDRYLLRELLVPFAYCLVGFLIFWISSDVFAQLSDFQKLKLTGADLFEYYTIRTPEMLITVLPRSQCEIVDTWHTMGLRSSGSHDRPSSPAGFSTPRSSSTVGIRSTLLTNSSCTFAAGIPGQRSRTGDHVPLR